MEFSQSQVVEHGTGQEEKMEAVHEDHMTLVEAHACRQTGADAAVKPN